MYRKLGKAGYINHLMLAINSNKKLHLKKNFIKGDSAIKNH